MKILITESGYLPQSKDAPIVGKVYSLERADTQTAQQRKAWHALVQELFKSGLLSYDTLDFKRFRDLIKKDYGAGFCRYKWVDDNYCINESVDVEDIPEHVLQAQADGQHGRINGVLKSFTDYTLPEVKDSIDKLLALCLEVGLNSKKYFEIVDGMESNN